MDAMVTHAVPSSFRTFANCSGRANRNYCNNLSKLRFRGNAATQARLQCRARASVATAWEERKAGPPGDGDYEETVSTTGVVIVGAGLAGLAAARQCAQQGLPFLVVEGSDDVGGRVRTDTYQGFLLDRGFQIFATAYPESQAVFDFEALDLHTLEDTVLVWFDQTFHRYSNPLKRAQDGIGWLFNPIGSVYDKLIAMANSARAMATPLPQILSANETSIMSRMKADGYSQEVIDRFWRPFFGLIFFDRELQTSSRLMDVVLHSVGNGTITLPADGIGAVPHQIAAKLPAGSVLLNSKVRNLTDDRTGVILSTGRVIKGTYGVVVATEGPEAARLLGVVERQSRPHRSTTCMYFAADGDPPIRDPQVYFNGSGTGIVNNMFFPSTVAPSYAPPGKTLVSVSMVGVHESTPDEELQKMVREELAEWFGAEVVESWWHLRTYRIAMAQPDQSPPTVFDSEPRVQQGLYVCGDHRQVATFQGALVSGRVAVQAMMADCQLTMAMPPRKS